MKLSRWITDKFPTWVLVSPWETCVLLIAFGRGFFFLTGLVPASAAEQSVPKPLLVALLTVYALAAAFTLANVVRGNLLMERAGLLALGPTALAYGITILSAEPVKGLYSIWLYALVAVAAAIRIAVIRKLLRINEYQLRNR